MKLLSNCIKIAMGNIIALMYERKIFTLCIIESEKKRVNFRNKNTSRSQWKQDFN